MNRYLQSPIYDPVCMIIETPFAKWNEKDQIDLIKNGRPKPLLSNKKMRNDERPGSRLYMFKSVWYDRYQWLCGSAYLQSLHCWPCLLFGSETERWELDEIEQMEEFSYIANHDKDLAHFRNLAALEDFLLAYKREQTRKVLEENRVLSSNETIQLNRQSVVYAIDAILAMIKKQFPFGEVEADKTGTHADITSLMLNASNNNELKSYIRKMKGAPNPLVSFQMQVGIVESIAECIEDYIHTIVKTAKFFSIRIDDGLNESNECSIFLRCINSNNLMKEYFLGNYSLGSDKTSLSLFRIIDSVLEKFQYKSKLIGICYDITCVKFNYLKDLRVGLKFMAQQAIHVNLFGHSIDYMLERCLCSIPTCRIFFSHLSSLLSLVQSFYKKGCFGDYHVWRDVNMHQGVCCSKVKLLTAMVEQENFATLRKVLEDAQQDDNTTTETLSLISSMLDKFRDFEFIFLCVLFNHVFQITDALYKFLLCNVLDAKVGHEKVKETCVTLYRQRNESFFNYLHSTTTRILTEFYAPETTHNRSARKNFKPLYYEILDNTIMELHTRFENVERYEFFTLAYSNNYDQMGTWKGDVRPIGTAGDNLCNHFPLLFPNKNDLQDQWQNVVLNKRFHRMPLWRIVQCMDKDSTKFNEVNRLFCLIMLLTPPKKEFSMQCLHKIKDYMDRSVADEIKPALAKILMNQEILTLLSCWYSFKDDVTNKLSVKCDTIKLSHMVKSLPKDPKQSNPSDSPSLISTINPNLLSIAKEPKMVVVDPESDMVIEIDPRAIVPKSVPQPFTEPGSSSRVEPDSSMTEGDITLAMTCEQFPANESGSPHLGVKIKEEPEDPSDILSANVERELGKFYQGSPSISSEDSLFQPPVLIKDEVVSEDEL